MPIFIKSPQLHFSEPEVGGKMPGLVFIDPFFTYQKARLPKSTGGLLRS
jgi:hypothetical protein